MEECAKLCLEKEGCNYFIVGNGKFRGVDKTGSCGDLADKSEASTVYFAWNDFYWPLSLMLACICTHTLAQDFVSGRKRTVAAKTQANDLNLTRTTSTRFAAHQASSFGNFSADFYRSRLMQANAKKGPVRTLKIRDYIVLPAREVRICCVISLLLVEFRRGRHSCHCMCSQRDMF